MNQELVNAKGYITTDQVKEMIQAIMPVRGERLCTIGNHGMRHSIHRKVSIKQIEKEYVMSRKILEDTFNTDVDSYTFPYGGIGEVSRGNVQMLKKCNCRLGFSTYEGTLRSARFTSKFFYRV